MASPSPWNQQAPAVHRNFPHPARRGKREEAGAPASHLFQPEPLSPPPTFSGRPCDPQRRQHRPKHRNPSCLRGAISGPPRSEPWPEALERSRAAAIEKWSNRRRPDRSRSDAA